MPDCTAPKDIEDRDWVRGGDATSEAGIFLALCKWVSDSEKMTGFSGNFTIRDCYRSVTLELDGVEEAREAMQLVKDYADKALRWIDSAEKRMRDEGTL